MVYCQKQFARMVHVWLASLISTPIAVILACLRIPWKPDRNAKAQALKYFSDPWPPLFLTSLPGGSNPHPANDRWVFMCKRGAPALTFRHCHGDEKRQPMKRQEPWHTPPGSEYTPASFRVVCGPGPLEGRIFHSLRAAPCGCTASLGADASSTPAPSPLPPTPRKKNET